MLKFGTQFNSQIDFWQPASPSLTLEVSSGIVTGEKRKPELAGSGFRKDSDAEPGTDTATETIRDGALDSSIISYPHHQSSENEHVVAEPSMQYQVGYIRIPRSLLCDPRFQDAPPTFRIVYITLLQLVAFKETEHNDHGKIIKIKPGQVCISIRHLADVCGRGISKKNVEQAIAYFKKSNLGGQEKGHRKNVISITHKDTYNLIVNVEGTSFGTSRGQAGDIKEECKESKDIGNRNVATNEAASRIRSVAGCRIDFCFDQRKWNGIEASDIAGWQEAYPAVRVELELRRMGEWLLANPTKRKVNYRKFIVNWLSKGQDRPEASAPSRQTRRGKLAIDADTAPDNFERTYL